MAVVFGAIATTWLVVIWVKDGIFGKEIGVDLIAELAGDGKEGWWGLCRRARIGLAACCVSSCNAVQKTVKTYDAFIVLSRMFRSAEEGDGKV